MKVPFGRILIATACAAALGAGAATAHDAHSVHARQVSTAEAKGQMGSLAVPAAYLTKAGITHPLKVELDDGLYEVSHVDAQGRLVETKIHATTGTVLLKKIKTARAAEDVQTMIRAAGVQRPLEIEADRDEIEVKHLDASGALVETEIDRRTGMVTEVKSWASPRP